MDNQEEMRQKRLARLAKLQPSSSSSAMEVDTVDASEPVVAPQPTPTPAPTPTPKVISSPPTVARPSTSPQSTPTPATRPIVSMPQMSEAEWDHQCILNVFRVAPSLQQIPRVANDWVLLPSMVEDLRKERGLAQDAPILFDPSLIDRILIERLSLESPPVSPLQFLISAYGRATSESSRQNSATEIGARRVKFLSDIQTLCVSYSGLIMQNPDMFPSPPLSNNTVAALVPKLLEEEEGLPAGYLADLFTRFADEGLDQLALPLLEAVSRRMFMTKLLDPPAMPLTRTLCSLLQHPQVLNLAAKDPRFFGNTSLIGAARMMESSTFLGPLFRPSSMDGDVKMFANPKLRQAEVASSISAVRIALKALHMQLHDLFLGLLKSGPTVRDSTLTFLANVINTNSGRSKLHVDPFSVSSDGFFLNITAVVLKLCDPFTDYTDTTKLDKINPGYALGKGRLVLSQETKLGATDEEIARWTDVRNPSRADSWQHACQMRAQRLAQQAEQTSAQEVRESIDDTGPFNFMTEALFMGVRCLHLGVVPAFQKFLRMSQQLSEMRQEKRKLEDTRARWSMVDALALRNQAILNEIQSREETLEAGIVAMEAHLLDPEFLQGVLRFCNMLTVWILRQAYFHESGYPLVLPPPTRFSVLPEHFVEDVADIFLNVARYAPQFIENIAVEQFLDFVICLVASSEHIKNPYLRAKLVEVLEAFLPHPNPPPNYRAPASARVFEWHKLAHTQLPPALMALYVDVEHTGSHTEFYDKFNIRFHISSVMEHIWTIHAYRPAFDVHEKTRGLWISFINMLLNDSIYLLEESLTTLPAIRKLEIEMADPAYNSLPQAEREEKEKNLQTKERIVKSLLQLGNKSLKILHFLTASIKSPFVSDEMVERLATMLNSFLSSLAGPRCQDLKVSNPDKFHFYPATLLGQIVDIYLHFEDFDQFLRAVVRDERYYRPEIFQKAILILDRKGLRPVEVTSKLDAFAKRVQHLADEEKDTEALLGDIPDNYLDPIMATLMTDPVILPTSGQRMDRKTIARMLLSDHQDPFNRKYLTVDMLQPDTELKQEIDQWLASKKVSL